MPFRSQAQRAFMHARHPEIAERWEKHTPEGAKLPEHVKQTRQPKGQGGGGQWAGYVASPLLRTEQKRST